MLRPLLQYLEQIPEVRRVIVTLNIPEELGSEGTPRSPKIEWICNVRPRGFGANHNSAFALSSAPYFCVVNPDIILQTNPLPLLIAAMVPPIVGVAAPKVINPLGGEEDSAREFPTALRLALKLIRGRTGAIENSKNRIEDIDWAGGMFLMFRASAFSAVHGFDERYFLYYEDVDICTRLWRQGYRVIRASTAVVTHDARRSSHRNMKYLSWHVKSAFRYMRLHGILFPRTRRIANYESSVGASIE
jgi:N-acetylglucosaminyl-diphospho-decaprenol L-rhamnosyltransferase